ncbi:tumor necrosis factor receptor superfamily member 1B-like isoform X2 [Xyrauchen texanus]|uniref:tumor necrosis factor receptor superfamily member 1B-like isoform X2 n=1 Tax=Xyrauchen texanus TaxID=154827 RepID=UPI0022424C3F|nr:tumor necrosis factor receptor superfamily member 1B-like isoform X2 [Xyrauchen texanus]
MCHDGQRSFTRGGSLIDANMILSMRLLIFLAALWRVSEGKTSLPYKSTGSCINSTSEYFNKLLRMCCSKCKPGNRQFKECTSELDTVCEPCPDGQYSENMNHYGNCFSCNKCDERGLMYATNCSAYSKSVCVCKPGMFCQDYFNGECKTCKTYKSCQPGEGLIKNGTAISNVKCAPCLGRTFSDHTNTEPCKPHTQCAGGSVLTPGTSTTDTKCKMMPSATTKVPLQTSPEGVPKDPPQVKPTGLHSFTQETQPMNMTVTTSLPASNRVMTSTITTLSNPNSVRANSVHESLTMNTIYCIVITVAMLVLLTLTVMLITCRFRYRKGIVGIVKAEIVEDKKQEQGLLVNCTPDCPLLLPTNGCQKEPSMTSSESHSQPDSSQSHISSDWIEHASQEETLPEQPSVSSPLVNLSITATFNCQMNPACCSIPLTPAMLTPKGEAPVQLSHEEVCISCQQEDGKEALQSVQESDPRVF